MSESELEALLRGSITIAELKKELGTVKLERDLLRDANANLRIRLRTAEARLQSDFEMSGDSLPSLLRRQI